jgi:hypothetical protein
MKNSTDTIVNRTRDQPVCSPVPLNQLHHRVPHQNRYSRTMLIWFIPVCYSKYSDNKHRQATVMYLFCTLRHYTLRLCQCTTCFGSAQPSLATHRIVQRTAKLVTTGSYNIWLPILKIAKNIYPADPETPLKSPPLYLKVINSYAVNTNSEACY